MGMFSKPHTGLVLAMTQSTDSGTKKTSRPTWVADEDGVIVQGYKFPEKATTAFERTGIEVREPYTFMCDLEDQDKFPAGCRIQFGALMYAMVGERPTLWDAGSTTDCCLVTMEAVEVE